MNKTGVLLIMSNPNGWRNPSVQGGAEHMSTTIINKMSDFNWYILLPTQLYDKFRDLFSSPHLFYSPIKTLFRNTNVFKDLVQGLFYTLKIILIGWQLRNKYSLIYAPTTNFSDIFPTFLLSIITRKPYITKYRISIYDGPGFWRIYQNYRDEKNSVPDSFIRGVLASVTLSLMKRAKLNLVPCNFLGNQLVDRGVNRETVRTNYHGLDFTSLNSYKDDSLKKKYDLCFIARIEKNKGVLDFINVVQNLKDQKPDISAVIVGDGTYLKEARSIINDRGLSKNITTTGFLEVERFKYLQQSRIFLSPTYGKEGFGITLLEALFFNTPIVAYTHPVFEEVFGSYNLVKLIKQDPALLTEVVSELLKNDAPTDKRFDLKKFSLDQCVQREKNIIIEAL